MDFSRNWLFIDQENQDKLKKVKVLFAGCGLGSYLATSLARMGVENFILADGDTVSESNLNRQMYGVKEIGCNKAQALANEIQKINPKANLTIIPKFLKKEDLISLIPSVDIVINAIDFDSPEFIVCNQLVKVHQKTELFSINLGFGAITMVFDKDTPDLLEFFKEEDCLNLKFKILDWAVEMFADDYFKKKYQEYKVKKTIDTPEPQIVVGALFNSAMTCKIVYDLISGNEVRKMPAAYAFFI